jgi:hypothetical protein
MANPVLDDKPLNGSINEKDTQVGTSEELYIDPAAEKKVPVHSRSVSLEHRLTYTQLIRKLDLILSPMMVVIFLVRDSD